MNSIPPRLVRSLLAASALTAAISVGADVEIAAGDFGPDHLPTLAGRIKWMATAAHGRGEFNGSLLVARGEQTIYSGHFGWQDLVREIPNSATTRYRLGSIGKQFTATAILLLMQDGALDVEDTVAEHLPDFKWEPATRVTLAHLLRHTSGTPRSVLDYVHGGIETRHSLADLLHGLEQAKLEFEPGQRFQYSNAGYTILAGVITAVAGQSYEEFLCQRIFGPAGLVETHFDFPEEAIEQDARGYRATASGRLHLDREISMSFAIGAGTFRTTPADMRRWDAALRSGKVLSAESQKLMYTPSAASRAYGFGWGLGTYRRPGGEGAGLRVNHGGEIEGFSTSLVRLVDDEVVIIAMANLRGARCDDLVLAVQRAIERGDELGGVDRVQLALRSGGIPAARQVCVELGRNEHGLLATAEQMVGPNDAFSRETWGRCWFPKRRDGKDVIELGFGAAVRAARVEIYGTQGQGGLSSLELRAPGTSAWRAVALEDPERSNLQDGLGTTTYGVAPVTLADTVRLSVDSGLIEGSNVVDAVALVAEDGTRHWAAQASATSDRRRIAQAFVPDAPTTDALVERARRLLEADLAGDALLVARFGALRDADSWRAQAGLGRAQKAVGDLDAAVRSFERALELKPDERAERRNLAHVLRQLRRARR